MIVWSTREVMIEQLKVRESEYAVKLAIAMMGNKDGEDEMFLLGMLVSIRRSLDDLRSGRACRTLTIE